MSRVLWPALIVAAGLFLVNLGFGIDLIGLSNSQTAYSGARGPLNFLAGDFTFTERPVEQAAVLPAN